MRRTISIGICTLLLMTGTAAFAGIEEGTWFIAIYGGNYDPSPDAIDDDSTAGLRIGYTITQKVALVGSVGVFETDNQFTSGSLSGQIDFDVTLLDLSLWRSFRTDRKLSPSSSAASAGRSFPPTAPFRVPQARSRFRAWTVTR